jgi:hypothetical protein
MMMFESEAKRPPFHPDLPVACFFSRCKAVGPVTLSRLTTAFVHFSGNGTQEIRNHWKVMTQKIGLNKFMVG